MEIHAKRYLGPLVLIAAGLLLTSTTYAGRLGLFGGEQDSDNTITAPNVTVENFEGRDLLVHAPSQLPPAGSRALVVVLHGGLGSAERVEGTGQETALSMDAVADKNGFVVAYLNGTRVAQRFDATRRGWNAGGGCCGIPAQNDTDDVGYITSAVQHLISKYGINPQRVYGMGHSNGAMMTQRMMCTTNLYAAAVVISGPLNLKTSSCPAARGKHILALHGDEDENVPVAGGAGTKGMSQVSYNSQADTQQVYAASGADYHLEIVKGADHKMTNLESAIERSENTTIAEKAARFFGLAH